MFKDRRDAGRQLAELLKAQRGVAGVVLGLPRGGVPVAFEIAAALQLPLDVLVVRKLGAPGQPELAMGAIAGAVQVMNPEVYRYFEQDDKIVAAIVHREQRELARREAAYRGERPPLALTGKVAILVDDGAATGASMRVAVKAARALGATRVIVALPVCSIEAEEMLRAEADEVVCVLSPRDFYAVGQWYRSFEQTSDEEVRKLLAARSDW